MKIFDFKEAGMNVYLSVVVVILMNMSPPVIAQENTYGILKRKFDLSPLTTHYDTIVSGFSLLESKLTKSMKLDTLTKNLTCETSNIIIVQHEEEKDTLINISKYSSYLFNKNITFVFNLDSLLVAKIFHGKLEPKELVLYNVLGQIEANFMNNNGIWSQYKGSEKKEFLGKLESYEMIAELYRLPKYKNLFDENN